MNLHAGRYLHDAARARINLLLPEHLYNSVALVELF
jgi:hypothetical protein